MLSTDSARETFFLSITLENGSEEWEKLARRIKFNHTRGESMPKLKKKHIYKVQMTEVSAAISLFIRSDSSCLFFHWYHKHLRLMLNSTDAHNLHSAEFEN